MDYKAIYEEWLSNPYFDEATKEELKAIADALNIMILCSVFYLQEPVKQLPLLLPHW